MADKANDELLKEALQNYENAYEYARANIDEALEDLRFRRGRKEDQWDNLALTMRKDRPTLTINVIPQFVRQVTGDMRQMRPAIKVNPVDSRGDIKTADVLAGLIRYVENRSNAKQVYTTAADSQVACGIGHWEVITEYAAASTFNQELRIKGIEDGVQVLWDPDSTFPTREDAMFCHVPFDISRRSFEQKWPDASKEGFAFEMKASGSSWYTGDSIRVSKYWVKKPFKRTLVLMPDGSIDDITKQTEGYSKQDLQAATEWYQANKGGRLEQRDSFKVCRYLITAAEVLETYESPGMHIPVIPVVGEEVRIEKEVYRHGVVRYARDPQRMVNYYASAEAEVIALQPKAPWVGTKKQFQDHLDKWETANVENYPFLEYTGDPQAQGPPQRVAPPQASQAIIVARQQSLEDTKRVIGIYDAGLGAKSNETSGKAILARQREGDVGTFVYIDNFGMAIQRTGQILLDLIPHIYDTQRTVRIVGMDGSESVVDINKPVMEGGIEKTLHDVTVAAYDVTLETGPSYSTKRQEAKDGMREFIQAFPESAPAIGDLYAKGQDWPMAEEIGDRLHAMLPAPIKEAIEAKEREKNPQAQQPKEPTPQELEAAEEQAKAKQAQEMQFAAGAAELEAKVEGERAKTAAAQEQARKAKADADKAEAEAERARIELQIARAKLAETHMSNLRNVEDHERGKEHEDDDRETERSRGDERHSADMARRSQTEAVQ